MLVRARLRTFSKHYEFFTDLIRNKSERKLYTSKLLDEKIAYKLSDIGEGIRDVVVKEWFVKVGDKVTQFDNICEVQSDKASVTITSRYDGTIMKLYHDVDETALVGQPLIDIEVETGQNVESSGTESASPVVKVEEATKTSVDPEIESPICIPSVRKLAKENNVNLHEIKGSGKDGRILKDDVLKILELKKPQTEATLNKSESIRGFRKAMVKTMTESLKVPIFMYSDELLVTKLSKLRESIKDETLKNDVKISFMPFFLKAVSNALTKHPVLNSSVDEACENITYKSAHNIGIAMDTKLGLAVPVVKNVQSLTIVEIAKELNRLQSSGKIGSFTPDDLTGGTFAISNIGSIGGTYTLPVILSPNVAIMALGKSRVLPRYDEKGAVVPEEVVSLSISADHRVLDGATVANFVTLVKKQVENPPLLFLGLF